MISHSLAGCGGIGPGSPNAALTSDRVTVNTGETINFDARTSTTPNPTIIDEFRWDFGDGEKKTTKQGVISHAFTEPGTSRLQLRFSMTMETQTQPAS